MGNHLRAAQSSYASSFSAYLSALSDLEWVMLAPFAKTQLMLKRLARASSMNFQTRSKDEKYTKNYFTKLSQKRRFLNHAQLTISFRQIAMIRLMRRFVLGGRQRF
jgi:hypothetical protein